MKRSVPELLYQRFNTWLTPPRIAFLTVLVYVLSLIPILWLAFYCHPAADDFAYSTRVHQAVLAGGGITEILSAAFATVRSYYFSWQGTFSAIFLFALQPGAFSESAYFLTPFLIIGALSISTFVAMHVFYCRLLGGSRSEAAILSSLTLLFSIQMVYDQSQAFYWFNGASYYAIFYAFALLFFAGVGTLLLDAEKKQHPILTVLCALLAILIGGGNYTTALTTSFILFVLCAALLYRKTPGRFKVSVILLILLVSFGISIVAPGNSVRASQLNSVPALTAILLSLTNTVSWSLTWLGLPQIVLFAIAAVFFYRLPSCPRLTYKYPLLASILLFGFYASQYTPALYAMGYIGAGRQVNIYYYSLYWWLLFTLYYWVHWFKNHRKDLAKQISSISLRSCRGAFFLLCILLMTAGLMASYDPLSSLQGLSSGSALTAILDGSAEAFDQAYQERLVFLNTPSDVCYVPENLPACTPFPEDPLVSSEDDPEYWRNECLADYYGHEKVLLQKAD